MTEGAGRGGTGFGSWLEVGAGAASGFRGLREGMWGWTEGMVRKEALEKEGCYFGNKESLKLL